MKKSKLFTLSIIAVTLLLNSCSKSDESPKLQFTFNGETITLKGANLYLENESTYLNRTYRDYFITDGVAVGDGGWSLSSYTGATYYLAIELASPVDGELVKGSFSQHYNWSNADGELPISYIYLERDNDFYYQSPENNTDTSPVIVSGGLNDGEKMTLKFSGTLTYEHYNGENWVEESVSGKFYFSGVVKDVRSNN
jgi:hypothetical protein